MAGPLSHILDPEDPVSQSVPVATQGPAHRPKPTTAHSAPATGNSASVASLAMRDRQALPDGPAPASMPAPPAPAQPAVTGSPNPSVSSSSTAAPSSRTSHTGQNLYSCRDCGRSYSRPEHLVRHVQTHTLGRRFVCDICQKSFARKDLLRRHVANHENDSPRKRRRATSSANNSPTAGRVSHACKACASARVKCDDVKPCQRCVARKLTCVSSEAGSAAAMHLMHLSADVHSTPPSRESASPSTSRGSVSPAAHSHSRSQASVSAISPITAEASIAGASLASAEPEESQLPTPDTMMDQDTPEDLDSVSTSLGSVIDANRLPFSEFLRSILFDQPAFDGARRVDRIGLSLLDFYANTNLKLTDSDFAVLDKLNSDGLPNDTIIVQEATSQRDQPPQRVRQSLIRAWGQSPWRQDPAALPGRTSFGKSPAEQYRLGQDRVIEEAIDPAKRDQVLGLLLNSGRQDPTSARMIVSFPSADILDTLCHVFLAAHVCQPSSWIHLPSFSLKNQGTEWVAMAAAVGATLTPVAALRKLGFVLQENARKLVTSMFDNAESLSLGLPLAQALSISLDVGLWSGNQSKTENSQSEARLLTMLLRNRGFLRRSWYPDITVEVSDDGLALEEKWRLWVEKEQWKRLVLNCYLRDAQMSMTNRENPSLSYADLAIPLPEARELWCARTAREWKTHALRRQAGQSTGTPSIGDLFHDVHVLRANHMRVDVQLCISIFLHGTWSQILEYRRLCSARRWRSYAGSPGGNANLLLNSRHQELVKDIQSFQLLASEWPDFSAREQVIMNLLLMNLHVSIEDLRVFAGQDGEMEARQIYPVLQQWVGCAEGRSAVWCAAQIFRYAKLFPTGHLRDFYAVAVYHAALTIWTYGVVLRASRRQPFTGQYAYEATYLDRADSMAVQRFIGFGQGRPLIQGSTTDSDGTVAESTVEDPRACMEIAQDVLQDRTGQGQEMRPLVVDNICRLMRQLGNAAWAAGLG